MLTACGQDKENNQGAVYVSITAEEAKQIMDTEEGYILLDVRTQEEYDEIADYLYESGIEDGFMQELSSAKEEYTPEFDLTGVKSSAEC